MTKFKKVIALVVCLLMCASVLVAPVSAATGEYSQLELDVVNAANIDKMNGEEVFIFEPETNGVYRFYTVKSRYAIWVELYDSDPYYGRPEALYVYSDGGRSVSFDYKLEAGKKYYFVCAMYNRYQVGSYDICINKVNYADKITIDCPDNATYFVGRDTYFYYKTEPESALWEEVKWTSSDESVATVDGGYVSFLSEGTATISVETQISGVSDSVEINVKDRINIELDEEISGSLADNCRETVYSYVPEVTGYYSINFSSDYETWFNLYNCNDGGNELCSYGSDMNLSFRLIAGTEYSLNFTPYYEEELNYDYSFSLTKLAGATAINIIGKENNVFYIGETTDLIVELLPEGCAQESVTWHSDNEEIATVSSSGCVRFLSEGTVNITVTTDDTKLTDSIEFIVRDIKEIELDTTVSGQLQAVPNRDYYKFTPAEDGVYSFNLELDGYSYIYGYLYNSNMSYITGDANSRSFNVQNELKANNTYYFEVRWYGESTADYKLSVIKPEAAESIFITDSNGEKIESISGYPDKTYWLNYDFAPSNCIREYATWSSSNEDVATVSSSGRLILLSAGEAEITVTSENNLTCSITVTVKTPETVTLDNTVSNNINIGEEHRYSFAPSKSGYYRLYISGNEEYNNTISIRGGKLNNGYGFSGDTYYDIYFEENTEYILYLYNYHYEELAYYSFTIKEAPMLESITIIDSDGNACEEISGAEGSESYLRYKLNPDDCVGESITWSSSDEAVATVNEGWLTFVSGGTAIITATSESGITASVTVYCESVEALALDEEKEVVVSDYDWKTYKFIPEKDGYYGFYVNSEDYYINCRITEFGDIYVNDDYGYQFTTQGELKAGKVYYVKVRCTNNEYAEFTLKAVELTKASSIKINGEKTTSYVGKYLNFDVSFDSDFCIKEKITWSSDNEDVATVNEYGNVQLLSEGTATITATSENGLTDEIEVTAVEMPIILLNEIKTIEINDANEVKSYKFVPSESGYYGVVVESEYYTGLELKYLSGGYINNGYGYNYTISGELTEGTEYCIDTYMYHSDEIGNYTIKIIKLNAPEYVSFDFGDEHQGYVGKDTYFSVSFGPEPCYREGYTITSDNEEVAYVESYGYARFLKEGTATLTVKTTSGLTDTIFVTVKEPTVLELNNTYGQFTQSEDEIIRYKFIPDESGIYSINMGSQIGVACDVRNEWNEYVDSNSGVNYSLYVDLTAGNIYYFDIYTYDSVGNGYVPSGFTISLTKPSKPEYIKFNDNAITEVNIGDIAHYNIEFGPEGCYEENYDFIISDESKVQRYHFNEFKFVEEGTVTITAVSESGLEASITVNISGFPEINLNETVSGEFYEYEDEYGYVFTPEKDGVYGAIITGGYSNSGIFTMDNERLAYNYGNDYCVQAELKAGTKYIFRIYSGNGRYNLTVKEITNRAERIEFDWDNIECYVGDRYSIRVLFYPLGSLEEEYTVTLSDPNFATVEWDTYEFCKAGSYTLTVTSESGLVDTLPVNVYPVLNVELDKEYSGTVQMQKKGQRYIFTPEEEGYYSFAVDSTGYAELNIEQVSMYGGYYSSWYFEGSNIAESIYMEEGYMYYFDIRNNSDTDFDYTIEFKKSVSPTGINISNGDIAGKVGDRYELSVNFVPFNSIKERIVWSSSDEKIAVMEDNELILKNPGVVTITATSESGLKDSITVTVADLPRIKEGINTVEIFGDRREIFKFIPKESANYLLYTQCNYDTVITVYDENMNDLVHSDDEDSMNFNTSYYFESGKTYYFEIGIYSASKATFDVYIEKTLAIKELQVVSYPKDNTLYEGYAYEHAVDFKGLELKAIFEDESEARYVYGKDSKIGKISVKFDYIFNPENGELMSVNVWASDKYVNIPIQIIENPVESIEAIGIDSLQFYENTGGYEIYDGCYYYEYRSMLDFKFKITYKDGSFDIVDRYNLTKNYEIDFWDDQYMIPWKVDANNILGVHYCGAYTQIPVTIVKSDIKNITLVEVPDITYYFGDEEFGENYKDIYYLYPTKFEGITLKFEYENGSSKTVVIDSDNREEYIDGYEEIVVDTVGEYEIDVSIKGHTISVPITVKESPVESVEVLKNPDKTVYGESFSPDFTGMQIKLNYTDSTSKIITVTKDNVEYFGYAYIVTIIKCDEGNIRFYYDYNTEDGTYVISYLGKTCKVDSFDYSLEAEVEEFKVNNLSVDHDKFDLTVNYTDGTSERFKSEDLVVLGNEESYLYGVLPFKCGLSIVSISIAYDDEGYGMITNYEVDVAGKSKRIMTDTAVTDFAISSLPNKTVYLETEKFNTDGLELMFSFSDGNTAYCDIGYTVKGFDSSKIGTQLITVTKGDYSATFEVEVKELIMGDANGDGLVNSDDMVTVKKMLLGLESDNIAADLNEDGVVDILDYILFKKGFSNEVASYALNLVESGDVDGNGDINIDDLVCLKKVIIGTTPENDACDTDGNGKVEIVDFIRLKKYLNGEDIELGGNVGTIIGGGIVWG